MRGSRIGRGDVLSGMMQEVTCNGKTAQKGITGIWLLAMDGVGGLGRRRERVSQEMVDEGGGWSIALMVNKKGDTL